MLCLDFCRVLTLKVCVDLFIYDHHGELMRYIPMDKVHLLPELYEMIERSMKVQVNGELNWDVCGRKKLGWIYTDYSTVFVDVKREIPIWSQLGYIASISDDVGEKFIEILPTQKNKLISIENILCPNFIQKRAGETTVSLCSDSSAVCLFTIGRFPKKKKWRKFL